MNLQASEYFPPSPLFVGLCRFDDSDLLWKENFSGLISNRKRQRMCFLDPNTSEEITLPYITESAASK
jgi:hypothetical protein